jgi:hypothetical protein
VGSRLNTDTNHLLARGVARRDVEEFLSGPRALASQLVDQGLAGGPRQEHPISVGDISQCIALPREAPSVLTSLFWLLLAVLEVPWVSGVFVGVAELPELTRLKCTNHHP